MLKDGTKLTVRVGEDRDADQLIENANHFIEHGEGQVLVPGELKLTHEDEIKWIRNHRDKPTNLLLVAEVEGKLVGHIDFYGASRKRLLHTGHFGLGIREEYRSRGVGKALLSKLISWAKGNGVIEKINLQVIANNARGIALYESLGFLESGRKRREIKLEDGSYVDDVSMELILK